MALVARARECPPAIFFASLLCLPPINPNHHHYPATAPHPTHIHTIPPLRSDGIYTAVALWGDADDTPTAVLLRAGSNTPLFNATTPGSMMGVDVVVDGPVSVGLTPRAD